MTDEKFPILGIDEAGRGPVIGPLVVSGLLCRTPEEHQALLELKTRDSKTLTVRKRDTLYTALNEGFEHHSIPVTPGEIDRAEESLNILEYQAMRKIIRHFNPRTVYIDAVGPPAALTRYLRSYFPDLVIRAAYKADTRFAVVSGASIIAKTSREEAIQSLKNGNGDFGSGYPSDPKTRAWLRALLDAGTPLPDYVRHSWGTLETLRSEGRTRDHKD